MWGENIPPSWPQKWSLLQCPEHQGTVKQIQNLSKQPGGKEQEHELQGTSTWWQESPAILTFIQFQSYWIGILVTLLVELVTRMTLQVAICFSIVRLNALKWRVWFSFFLAWEHAGRPWSIDPPQSAPQPSMSRSEKPCLNKTNLYRIYKSYFSFTVGLKPLPWTRAALLYLADEHWRQSWSAPRTGFCKSSLKKSLATPGWQLGRRSHNR